MTKYENVLNILKTKSNFLKQIRHLWLKDIELSAICKTRISIEIIIKKLCSKLLRLTYYYYTTSQIKYYFCFFIFD
jgi:hypothetical protein